MTRPTHISYSSISDAQDCPYRFKLRAVDRIRLFPNSIDTIFGTIMHQCIQDHLQSVERNELTTAKRFHRVWKKFCSLYRSKLPPEKIKAFLIAGLNACKCINKTFQDFQLIAVEQEINVPVSPRAEDVNFKGYIDLLMEHGNQYSIIDLKTSKSTATFKKYLTPMKKYQLAYYAKYTAQEFKINQTDFELLYIVIEKDPKSKNPIQLVPIKFTPDNIEKSEQVLNKTIQMIDDQSYHKNRNACHNPYTGIKCAFYETPYCT